MFKLALLFVFFLLNEAIQPQYIIITKVINSNLFELRDSTRIKLAGVDMPRLNNPDYLLRKVAKDAVLFSKVNLVNKPLQLKVLSENDGVKLVYLVHEYPLSFKNHNLSFLEQGFGKFVNNIDTNDLEKFREAEKEGRDDKKGIWKIGDFDFMGVLDREFTEEERNDEALTDSLEYLIKTTPEPGFGHVAAEVLLGPAVGFITGLPTALFFVGIGGSSGWDALGYGLLGWYTGYIIGNGLCTYAIADNTTKKVNPFGAIMFSALGGGLALLSLENDRSLTDDWMWFSLLVFPTVSSVLYANVIAEDKYPVHNISSRKYFDDKTITAADHYNSTKLFEVNLLTISF